MSRTERYYIEGERYDWTRDPKRLEKIFHRRRAGIIARIFNAMPSRLRRSALFLDLGAGTGLISRQLNAGRVVLADINRWNLERARENLWGSGDYVICSASALPFVQLFSGAVITEVLEHLDRPWEALAELWRVLQPGALVIGSVPSRSIVWRFRRILSSTHPHSEPFHNNYAMTELVGMLGSGGWQDWMITKSNFGLNLVFEVRR